MKLIEQSYEHWTTTPTIGEIASGLQMPYETVYHAVCRLDEKGFIELAQPFGNRQVIRLLWKV